VRVKRFFEAAFLTKSGQTTNLRKIVIASVAIAARQVLYGQTSNEVASMN
jgi:hypothetical protein